MANDIQITVGAKDTASKVLSKVGKGANRLNSRVTAMAKASQMQAARMKASTDQLKDLQKYVKQVAKDMAKQAKAQQNAAKSNKDMANAVGRTNGLLEAQRATMSKLKGTVMALVGAYLGLQGLRKISQFALSAADAFNTQEAAAEGLAKALELAGENTNGALESHKAFASAMQESLGVGDEVTLAMMKQASMAGVSSDQLQNVTTAAIGLAEATGIDLETAMKRTIGAMNGVYGELGEMIPSVRNATTEEEKLAAVSEIAAKGLEQKKDAAARLSTIMQKARNAVGDLMEKIGELMSPILSVIYSGIKVLSEVLIDMTQNIIDSMGGVDGMTQTLSDFGAMIMEKVIAALTFAEVIFLNFGKVVSIAMTSAKIPVIGFVEDVKHFFTVVIPEYGKWFARNWVNLIRDAFMAIVTIAYNRMKQMADTIMTVIKFILSGGEGGVEGLMGDLGEIMGRSLLDGFTATTEPLPEIAARQLTATEQRMRQELGDMTGDLAEEFDQKFNARMEKARAKAETDGVDLDPLKGMGGGKKDGGKAGGADLTAVESRLLTGTARRQTTEQLLSELVNETKKQNDKMDEIVENTEYLDDIDLTKKGALKVKVIP